MVWAVATSIQSGSQIWIRAYLVYAIAYLSNCGQAGLGIHTRLVSLSEGSLRRWSLDLIWLVRERP